MHGRVCVYNINIAHKRFDLNKLSSVAKCEAHTHTVGSCVVQAKHSKSLDTGNDNVNTQPHADGMSRWA